MVGMGTDAFSLSWFVALVHGTVGVFDFPMIPLIEAILLYEGKKKSTKIKACSAPTRTYCDKS